MEDLNQRRYLEGVALWRERRLSEAESVLLSLVGEFGPGDDAWAHSAARALAQMALEADDEESAEWLLRRLPGTGVGDAQTLALRARRWFQLGEEEAALAEIHAASIRLAADKSDDVGSLMNGAIALIWCAEVLVELGFADDTAALLMRARARMGAAGIDDRVLQSALTMIEASVARLVGDVKSAQRFLDQVDPEMSGDLEVQAIRERARLAASSGLDLEASHLYQQAAELARETGYSYFERSIADELAAGSPSRRTDRAPVGQWDPRAMEHVPDEHQPYALVIRLRLDDDEVVLDFEQAVLDFLRNRPALGYVDGSGTDGEIWELFLNGDDPDALWDAVHPLLEPGSLWKQSEVTKRSGSGAIRFRPSAPQAP